MEKNQAITFECQGCGSQQTLDPANAFKLAPVCCGQPMKHIQANNLSMPAPDAAKRKLKFHPGERVRVRSNMPYLPAPFAYTMGRTGRILYAYPDSKGYGEGEYQAHTTPLVSQLYVVELDERLNQQTEERRHVIQENWLDLLEEPQSRAA